MAIGLSADCEELLKGRPTYEELLEVAFDAYNQFAYSMASVSWADDRLTTGGLSTLERIRDVLGIHEHVTRADLWTRYELLLEGRHE